MNGSSSPDKVSFSLQTSVFREKMTLEKTDKTLSVVKEIACTFIDRKFPDHGVSNLLEKVALFKHTTSGNMLLLINDLADITDGCVLEAVIMSRPVYEEGQIRPHILNVHTYKSPTFCDFCGEFLWGIIRQGVRCECCCQNFHKRCARKIPNSCPARPKPANKESISEDSGSNSLKKRHNTGTNGSTGSSSPRPQSSYSSSPHQVKVPHSFCLKTFTKVTRCTYCSKILLGLYHQGYQCKDCKLKVHKECAIWLPDNCMGEPPIFASSDSQSSITISAPGDMEDDPSESDGEPVEEVLDPKNTLGDEFRPRTFRNFNWPCVSVNIPVRRLWVSVKKRATDAAIKEGWMIHFTNKEAQRQRHFWRLSSKSLVLYQNQVRGGSPVNIDRPYLDIKLSEIVSLEIPLPNEIKKKCPDRIPYVIEMELSSGMVLYVGEDYAVGGNQTQSGEKDGDSDNAMAWYTEIRKALMPLQGGSQKPDTGLIKDFFNKYSIDENDVLGSGQFGIVYGGWNLETSSPVAIKVIDRKRFVQPEQDRMRNEIDILRHLDHPGVVRLDTVHEIPEKVYVVTEKLHGDMLELILTSKNSRLSERRTKFLVHQVLTALRHLHAKDIAHCDLKPENVLLATASEFPLVKLCDFGYAKIIGEKSFRRSIVGTPAYLAPEALRSNRQYNRSLDIWSVGVIVYVSLSGTFPFNEDEEIIDQIRNAAFMYPPEPWDSVAIEARELIQCFLTVDRRKRCTVRNGFMLPWFQDYTLYQDLHKLENELGQRWLTSEADDEKWDRARQHSPLRQAISTT